MEKKNGLQESYYGNGQLRWKGNYKNGYKVRLKFYNEDGSLDRTKN